jgi:periplasmic divalent cation tolerance protein
MPPQARLPPWPTRARCLHAGASLSGMTEPAACLLVLGTCPHADIATRIARVLVEERLAACVNRVSGVVSTYRWQDEVHDDAEVLLLIKTRHERLDALRARWVALHPYEVSELIAIEIAGGLPAYLDWITRETAP